MLKKMGVTYLPEHLLPMCPVYTAGFGEGGQRPGGVGSHSHYRADSKPARPPSLRVSPHFENQK
jgi:hypothetical protein